MGSLDIRPRVYIQYRAGDVVMRRVVDLAYLNGQPLAVFTWGVAEGRRVPRSYALLDPDRLTPSVPRGTWWYDGQVEDPPKR